jgi:Na+/H+ antiporter NhaC
MEQRKKLEFHGSIAVAFIPLIVFLGFCILYFVILKAFEMYALAMGGIVGLMIGALFSKNYGEYWNAVCDGIANRVTISIVLILFVIGMFSAMIKSCNVSGGFVWLANSIGMHGSAFTVFTFVALCIIATATGSSIGTMFTAFPIFYPAGVILGANPAVLAGAIVSGAIFGDNLAPISDTTIMSASTQEYTTKPGTADIGGCVSTRFKYSLAASLLACVFFALFGSAASISDIPVLLTAKSANPVSLIMLIPVGIMLIVSVKTRDIYKAITVGLLLGTITGLGFHLISWSHVLNVTNGTPGGFLSDGISGMMATATLVISVFGIMGVLKAAGAFELVTDMILSSKAGKSVRGAELLSAAGICITTILFGGVTSASIITFGPILNQVGKDRQIHPYRRANLLDGFANSLPVCIPFLSVFVYLGALLTKGYEGIPAMSAVQVAAGMIYPFCLFVVLLFAVISGWGRRFEGPDGIELKTL